MVMTGRNISRMVIPMPIRVVRIMEKKSRRLRNTSSHPSSLGGRAPGSSQPRNTTYNPVQPKLIKARGISTYQPKFIRWSTRMRGNVQRIHMATKIKKYVLIKNQTMGGKIGPVGPPKKNVAARAEKATRLVYSARKKMAQRIRSEEHTSELQS